MANYQSTYIEFRLGVAALCVITNTRHDFIRSVRYPLSLPLYKPFRKVESTLLSNQIRIEPCALNQLLGPTLDMSSDVTDNLLKPLS